MEGPEGAEIGRIVQENVFGTIRFTLQSSGQVPGAIKGRELARVDFRIGDATETEIARITTTFDGVAKTLLTTTDNDVGQLHVEPEPTRHALVVASRWTRPSGRTPVGSDDLSMNHRWPMTQG